MHGYIYTLPPQKKSGQPNPTPVLPQHFKIGLGGFFFWAGWRSVQLPLCPTSRRPQEYIPDNQIQLTALGQKQGEAAGEQIRTLVGNSTVPWGPTTKRNAAMICWNRERNGNSTFFFVLKVEEMGKQVERCRDRNIQKLIVVACYMQWGLDFQWTAKFERKGQGINVGRKPKNRVQQRAWLFGKGHWSIVFLRGPDKMWL